MNRNVSWGKRVTQMQSAQTSEGLAVLKAGGDWGGGLAEAVAKRQPEGEAVGSSMTRLSAHR